jgi:hypothetical protein
VETSFITVQVFMLVFLVVHDWIPLGSLNDVAGVRRQNAFGQLAVATLINSVPIAVTLGLSFAFFRAAHPAWVKITLVAILGLYCIGELFAWWIPYAVGASPERTARYKDMFGKTHAFLHERHGITPNTAHVALHAATVVALAQALWLSLVM